MSIAGSRAADVLSNQTQIVAQWSDDADFDFLAAIAERLITSARDTYEVDGHDVGSGTFNVFIYADDAKVDAAIALVIQLCKEGVIPPEMKLGVAVYQDVERTEWTFRPEYPPSLSEFELM